MLRQCAWCLCLINEEGERISSLPLSKRYEATHGMCNICGIQWMEQVAEAQGISLERLWMTEMEKNEPETERLVALLQECTTVRI